MHEITEELTQRNKITMNTRVGDTLRILTFNIKRKRDTPTLGLNVKKLFG